MNAKITKRNSKLCTMSYQKQAFTLIEVLVVVAIIALLLAILIPSLQSAREQAKIACCTANCKQIATITTIYQAEYKGYVPVIFNYGGLVQEDYLNGYSARSNWISVAFHAYDKGTKNLAGMQVSQGTQLMAGESAFFKPQERWSVAKRQDFEDRVIPKYYICPFVREKGGGLINTGTTHMLGQQCKTYEWRGKHNSYHPWMWEGRIVRGYPATSSSLKPDGEFWRNDLCGHTVKYCKTDGRPKYSVLSWNRVHMASRCKYTPPPGFIDGYGSEATRERIENSHRKWSAQDAQRQRSGSLSDVTVLHCIQGQTLGYHFKVWNKDSHRSNQGGGTVTVFADSHVGWVKGTQIGWQ